MNLRDYFSGQPHGALKAMAKRLKVWPGTLSSLEKRPPGFDLALRISAATGGQVSVEKLMGQEWRWPAAARLRETDPVPTPEQIAALDFELRCWRHGLDPTSPGAAELLAEVEIPDESEDLPAVGGWR